MCELSAFLLEARQEVYCARETMYASKNGSCFCVEGILNGLPFLHLTRVQSSVLCGPRPPLLLLLKKCALTSFVLIGYPNRKSHRLQLLRALRKVDQRVTPARACVLGVYGI